MKRAIAVVLLGLSLSGCGFDEKYHADGVNPMPVYLNGGSARDLCETGKGWACKIRTLKRIEDRHVLVQTSLNGGHSDATVIGQEVLKANKDINHVTIHDYAGYAVGSVRR